MCEMSITPALKDSLLNFGPIDKISDICTALMTMLSSIVSVLLWIDPYVYLFANLSGFALFTDIGKDVVF